MATDLETSVAELIVNTNIVSDVINEDAATEVSTSNGTIPSLRKALADNIYFQDPIPWSNGSNETEFNQLRTFTDGTVWWSPSATTINPVPMGSSPVGDSNWYPWQDRNLKNNIIEEVTRFNIKGTFAAGFVYETLDDVGLDNNGTPWSYTGSLPFTVPAGTVPSAPDYQQVTFNSIDSVVGLRDELNDRAIYLTIAEAQAKTDLVIGQYVRLTDRGGEWLAQALNSPNTYDKIDIGENIMLVLQHEGEVDAISYGFREGVNNASVFRSLVADQSITKLNGAKKTFDFGSLGVNEILATRTTNSLDIDWRGARLTVTGDNTVINTSMAFLALEDVNGSMGNYEFEDLGFNIESSIGRGVQPLAIINRTRNTSGYKVGPCRIISGQSIVTAFSSDPVNFRASDIVLVGDCTADDSYYGVNLASNGDNCSGVYSVNRCVRLAFIYQVKGARLKGYCETNLATNGAVNISSFSQYADDDLKTENAKLDMSFGTLNGPVLFNVNNNDGNPSDDGKGVINDIEVKISAEALGTNVLDSQPVIIFRDFNNEGNLVVGSTAEMDNIRIVADIPSSSQDVARNISDSPNFGLLSLDLANFSFNPFQLGSFTLRNEGNSISRYNEGSFSNSLRVDLRYLYQRIANQQINLRAKIATRENNNTFNQISAISIVDLLGYIDSAGNIVFVSERVSSQTIFGGVTPTFTFSAIQGVGFNLSVGGYTNGALNKVSIEVCNLS